MGVRLPAVLKSLLTKMVPAGKSSTSTQSPSISALRRVGVREKGKGAAFGTADGSAPSTASREQRRGRCKGAQAGVRAWEASRLTKDAEPSAAGPLSPAKQEPMHLSLAKSSPSLSMVVPQYSGSPPCTAQGAQRAEHMRARCTLQSN